MEEVDNIIIHSLRMLGCDIEDNVTSLKEFSTELVVEAAVKCLNIIQPGLGISHILPPSMSARYKISTNIAQACQNLGYSGDIGYQSLLYSNEADIRRIFVFLLEKLPKESEKSIVEPIGYAEKLHKSVSQVLSSQLKSSWIPSYCHNGIRWNDNETWSREGCGNGIPFRTVPLDIPHSSLRISEAPQAWRDYYVHHLPIVTGQTGSVLELLASLISFNTQGLLNSKVNNIQEKVRKYLDQNIKVDEELSRKINNSNAPENLDVKSKSTLSKKLIFTKEQVKNNKSNEALVDGKIAHKINKSQLQEEKIETAKQGNERIKCRIEDIQLEIKNLSANLSQVDSKINAENKILKEKEKSYPLLKQLMELLPDAENNISILQESIDENNKKLSNLANQWENHHTNLQKQYEEATKQISNKSSENKNIADALKQLKEKSNELKEEINAKEQLHSHLINEHEKINRDINRSAYTRRIMEIIGNICKQRNEIDKVLLDTKYLQKEINNLTGQVDRSFTVADELIFKDAKKDDSSRRAYKLLASLHSDCSEIVNMVQETGTISREIRDLEEQIEHETAKNVKANLERISADLKQMKQESSSLTAQLKS